jgi:exo-1,4-beta-D-glucosaminidase
MMVRHDPRRIEQQVRMAQDMGLNTIRLESKLETPDFFELTDRLGMLVMPGWCCCHHWEEWDQWDAEDHKVAEHSQRDQLMRLRKHPSVFVWLNASDMPPTNPEVEKMYIRVLKETHWPTPYLSSATAKVSKVTGETGVKMNGPYDFVPPVYWLEDPEKYGGAWSFATEISPGGAPPPIESMRQMLPPDKLWPVNDWWLYHAGGGQFKDIKIFTKAQDKRYGPSRSAEEFTTKSQMMAYEGLRAMFEAFSRNKYNSTGVIQWMMNDAWPSIIWHQFDVYLRANGGYYGTKKACQPLHAMYSYNDRSVWLISSQYTAAPGLKVTARVFDFDMNQKHVQEATLDAPPDSTQKVFTLPSPQGVSGTYFVHLAVTDGSGKQVSSNLYWLSTKPDTLDWKKSTWYYTPTSSYADFTALNRLPKVQLRTTSQTERQGEQLHTRVVLENTGKTVAFFIRLQLMKGAGEELLPVYWEDNYLSLLPGEKREVVATVDAHDAGTAEPRVVVTGWNVNP